MTMVLFLIVICVKNIYPHNIQKHFQGFEATQSAMNTGTSEYIFGYKMMDLVASPYEMKVITGVSEEIWKQMASVNTRHPSLVDMRVIIMGQIENHLVALPVSVMSTDVNRSHPTLEHKLIYIKQGVDEHGSSIVQIDFSKFNVPIIHIKTWFNPYDQIINTQGDIKFHSVWKDYVLPKSAEYKDEYAWNAAGLQFFENKINPDEPFIVMPEVRNKRVGVYKLRKRNDPVTGILEQEMYLHQSFDTKGSNSR